MLSLLQVLLHCGVVFTCLIAWNYGAYQVAVECQCEFGGIAALLALESHKSQVAQVNDIPLREFVI